MRTPPLTIEKKVENEVVMGVAVGLRHEKFMACISSHEKTPRRIIRKAAKLATRYNTVSSPLPARRSGS